MRSVWKEKAWLAVPARRNPAFRQTAGMAIPAGLVAQRVSVYNGKKLESLIVRPYMVGQQFANFVSSRYSGKSIHVKKKKRKKKK